MNPDPHARLLELDAACRNVQQATAAILRRVERGGERATAEEYAGARSAVLRALLPDAPRMTCCGRPMERIAEAAGGER